MKNAEYQENLSCPQRDSAEHEGYAGAQSVGGQEVREQDGAELLERILSRDNLNRAYKRVKANKGAPGIDGMTVEQALPWLREHREELLETIRQGKYKPQPVRRKEIPKPDGGVRKLGIPTFVPRIIQQAIAQQLTPIYEPLFSDNSFGYRPGRSAQMAILKVKEYAERGYTQAVLVDLSKYFDTLNHELLMNLLRKNIHDKRVIELMKRYLKAGVMEKGLLVKTEEGSPQGGPLSPLLANIYLNEYDKEMERRGVPVVRYADDIVVLAKSKRAAERLLETTQRYLEGKLKLNGECLCSRCRCRKYHTDSRCAYTCGYNRNGYAYKNDARADSDIFEHCFSCIIINRLKFPNRSIAVVAKRKDVARAFQTWLNFDGFGVARRLNQKDGEFLLLFHAAPPQSS